MTFLQQFGAKKCTFGSVFGTPKIVEIWKKKYTSRFKNSDLAWDIPQKTGVGEKTVPKQPTSKFTRKSTEKMNAFWRPFWEPFEMFFEVVWLFGFAGALRGPFLLLFTRVSCMTGLSPLWALFSKNKKI